MAPIEEMHAAMVNKSIRTIKAELEFLTDASVISPQTLSELLNRIPEQTALHAPISVGAVPTAQSQAGRLQPPTDSMAALNVTQTNNNQNHNAHYDEKRDHNNQQSAPPSYNDAPQPSWPAAAPIAHATALYAYSSADKGDLELQPNDQIAVTEYLNAEWWKGKSARTDMEGIFPRSYVRVNEAPNGPGASNYGNMPADVAQGNGGNADGQPGKGAEMGKKFGKKLGNAAIFGAGATIGSNLVNSIF